MSKRYVRRAAEPAREHTTDDGETIQVPAREVEYYEPHETDPSALTRECPICKASVGSWCGGFGDVHDERLTTEELQALVEQRKAAHAREQQDQPG